MKMKMKQPQYGGGIGMLTPSALATAAKARTKKPAPKAAPMKKRGR